MAGAHRLSSLQHAESSQVREQAQAPALAGGFFPAEPPGGSPSIFFLVSEDLLNILLFLFTLENIHDLHV